MNTCYWVAEYHGRKPKIMKSWNFANGYTRGHFQWFKMIVRRFDLVMIRC